MVINQTQKTNFTFARTLY